MPCLPRLVLGLRFAEFLLLEALQHAPAGRVSGEGARVVMDRESLTRIEDKSALRDMTTPCSARPRSLDWARAFGTEPEMDSDSGKKKPAFEGETGAWSESCAPWGGCTGQFSSNGQEQAV